MDFNTRFESSIKELESSIGATNAFLVAHWYLEKINVSSDKRSHIITGALNKYDYEALRASATACIPRVNMLRGDGK